MIILAVDQSSTPCTVAVLRDETVLAEESWAAEGLRNQHLFDRLPVLLRRADLAPADIELFVTGAGPGAFTALRMAAATLSGLALPGRARVVGLPSCEAAAFGLALSGAPSPISILGDARRGRFWHAQYQAAAGGICVLRPPELLAEEDLAAALREAATVASPEPAKTFMAARAHVSSGVQLVEERVVPHAITLARLALDRARRGDPLPPPVPIYLTPATTVAPRFI
jgi:tRNA threonylcarbamoyl adenosine modification protein YeaZ